MRLNILDHSYCLVYRIARHVFCTHRHRDEGVPPGSSLYRLMYKLNDMYFVPICIKKGVRH